MRFLRFGVPIGIMSVLLLSSLGLVVQAQHRDFNGNMGDICEELKADLAEMEAEDDPELRAQMQNNLSSIKAMCEGKDVRSSYKNDCDHTLKMLLEALREATDPQIKMQIQLQINQMQQQCAKVVNGPARKIDIPPPTTTNIKVDEYKLFVEEITSQNYGDGNTQYHDEKDLEADITLQVRSNRVGVDGQGTLRYKTARGTLTSTDPPCQASWNETGQTSPAKLSASTDDDGGQDKLHVYIHNVDTPGVRQMLTSKCPGASIMEQGKDWDSLAITVPLFDGGSAREDRSQGHYRYIVTARLKKIRTFYENRSK